MMRSLYLITSGGVFILLWMGSSVALITTGIMCYWSVVTGWCRAWRAG